MCSLEYFSSFTIPNVNFSHSRQPIFILFSTVDQEELLKRIDFFMLKEIAVTHRENIAVFDALRKLGEAFSGVAGTKELLDTLDKIKKEDTESKCRVTKEEGITFEEIFEALKGLGVSDPENVLCDCKKIVSNKETTINENYLQSKEEAVVITSYTYEDETNKTSPYKIINKKLWEGKGQDQLINKKSYLHLLFRAFRKLPRTKPQTLYRGITKDKKEYKYEVGKDIEWEGFTSTSTSMEATQVFITDNEINKIEGTLFEIRNAWGYDLRDFSDYKDENGN